MAAHRLRRDGGGVSGWVEYLGLSDRGGSSIPRMHAVRCGCGLVSLQTEAQLEKRLPCTRCRGKMPRKTPKRVAVALTEHLRQKARQTFASAVRAGELQRPDTCDVCGSKHHRIAGHHDDYDRPLDVMWLCSSCHLRRHGQLTREGRDPATLHHSKHVVRVLAEQDGDCTVCDGPCRGSGAA